MRTIQLKIPKRYEAQHQSVEPRSRQVKSWIASLPIANVHETSNRVLDVLAEFNRTPIPVSERHAIMSQIQPIIEHVVKTIKKEYNNASFPLTEKLRLQVQRVTELLTETAYGYKIIVADLTHQECNEEVEDVMLMDAIHYSIHYLSRILLEHYLIYEIEPSGIWTELHQLYQYTEKNAPYLSKTQYTSQEDLLTSIYTSYKRALLLSLANPYHLMQGEANRIDHYLDEWAHKARIASQGSSGKLVGKFVVDLATDAPPRCITASMANFHPINPRVLDANGILKEINDRISAIAEQNKVKGDKYKTSLGRRLRRDMFVRLENAWGVRSERLSPRATNLSRVRMAIGMSACNHYIDQGKEFNPEFEEIQIRQHNGETEGIDHIELVSEDFHDWASQDMQSRLATGIVKPRTSQFDANEKNSNDMWVKVYATEARRLLEDEGHQNLPSYTIDTWHKKNDSSGGLGLYCDHPDRIKVNVGELVAIQPDGEDEEWKVGLIRWMRIRHFDSIHIGIKILADDASAVATKGIKGVGAGGEYFRGLVIPKLDMGENPTTLLTPAAIYDVDSVLLVNIDSKLYHLRMTRLLQATKSFSHFKFELTDNPVLKMESSVSHAVRAEKILR